MARGINVVDQSERLEGAAPSAPVTGSRLAGSDKAEPSNAECQRGMAQESMRPQGFTDGAH